MKLPGYWLSNFNRICVTMHFAPGNVPSYAAILVNYSSQSLYSALNKGIKMTYQVDLSTIKTPPGINKTCLVQGFNMHGQQSWQIKSRVGLESQPSPTCLLPYLVRGVGIDFMGDPITCGDIIVHYSHSLSEIKTYPAFCRIFTQ